MKGFNKLLNNSFKYLGLLLVNPLKGVIPGIAMQTLITKNLVHNLYNNLSWEEERKMIYESIDYSVSISNAIDNLDYTSSLVDSTLEEIMLLKSKYNKDFSKYSENISGYKDVIKFEDEKNKKAAELKKRDIDFYKLKDDMYNIDKEKDRYDSFVKQQEEF